MVMDFLPPELQPWFNMNFGVLHLLAMSFVLGNFFTATADDLDHMSSTKGFLKTWSIIVFIVLLIDVGDLLWQGYDFNTELLPLIVKWVLLIVFCTLSHMNVGVIFKLATGDVVAIASAAALLSPFLLIIFFMILKVMDLIERPVLRKFGDGDAYPFMPVVFSAYGIMLFIGLIFSDIIQF